jgi:hypothetical protein
MFLIKFGRKSYASAYFADVKGETGLSDHHMCLCETSIRPFSR